MTIQIQQLGVYFGQRVLFDNVTLNLYYGNRYGIVGANGSGKTTFLKILSRVATPENGKISIPKDAKVGVLRQDHYSFENMRINDVVLMGKETLWNTLSEKEELLSAKTFSDAMGHRLAQLEMIIADENGYEAEAEASEILAGLGVLPSLGDNLMSSLSGGYKLRVLLAQCLFSSPDILLLDEPTNHLDMASIAWLEEYLQEFKGILVVISHDHHLLDKVSTHILDVDYEEIRSYSGNYQQFIKQKELDEFQKQRDITRQEKKKNEMEQFIARFSAKATKARQANSRKKVIDKMEDIHITRSSRVAPHFSFFCQRPSGKQVLHCRGLEKSFGEKKVIHDLSFELKRGEKLAVIGANGIGKSTLLKILTEKISPDSGSFDWGYEAHVGYCPQNHHDAVPNDTTPYEWLYQHAPGETIGVVRKTLARMLFSGDDVHKNTGALSGGERARLIFSRLIYAGSNVLILDEPTNHMDLETIAAISTALRKYEGTLILVSHDRYFVQEVADAVLELRHDGSDYYPGGYAEYLEKQNEDYLDRTNATRPKNSTTLTHQKIDNKKVRQLAKKLKNTEKKLEECESRIKSIHDELEQPKIYTKGHEDQYKELLQEKKKLSGEVERLMVYWEKGQQELESLSAE